MQEVKNRPYNLPQEKKNKTTTGKVAEKRLRLVAKTVLFFRLQEYQR